MASRREWAEFIHTLACVCVWWFCQIIGYAGLMYPVIIKINIYFCVCGALLFAPLGTIENCLLHKFAGRIYSTKTCVLTTKTKQWEKLPMLKKEPFQFFLCEYFIQL